MRLKCVGCEVLARPLYLCAARSPHIVDVELVRHGLHDHPAELRTKLQERIAALALEACDAVVLGYGLCGKAIAGLTAQGHPLVVPRAHDCITLFLASRARYQDEFDRHPGTYWYAPDYVERRNVSDPMLGLGSSSDAELAASYQQYVVKFGKDNADYLMQVMGAWRKHYARAAFVDMGIGDSSAVEALARADAEQRGWVFERLAGDLALVAKLLDGDWDDDFLVVPPGQQVVMTGDDQIIGCEGAGE